MSVIEKKILDQIVLAARHLPEHQQLAYVREACGSDRLLYESAAARLTSEPTRSPWFDLDQPSVSERFESWQSHASGAVIGPYRVLRSLGHGGMGEVLLAERNDKQFEQRVAIKLVKRGLLSKEVQARLRLERQILASLEHPNIARLLDGGTTANGIPYLVMEYVDGKPIDTYCDEHRLTIKQRVQLFRSVCSAVERAHQNLIVHRDLKPSNILVTDDGVPKLLDFGIAKLLDTRQLNQTLAVTQHDVRMLTPDHASPEQLRGDLITTASDTYVLGVLLYELLTGLKPFTLQGNSLADLERAICDQLPLAPSEIFARHGTQPPQQFEEICAQRSSSHRSLKRELQGDLSNIVLMALRKEPARRYSSVQQFADDLERYLSGMPVRARADTWTYRSGKFIKRNFLVVALSTAFIATLIGSTVITSIQSHEAAMQRDIAARQGRLAEDRRKLEQSVSSFLINLFESADPAQAHGKDSTATEILASAAMRIRTQLAGQPRQLAVFLNRIGRVYTQRKELTKAQPLLQEAVDTLQKLKDSSSDTADAMLDLAEVSIMIGETAKAEALIKLSMDLSEQLEGPSSRGIARAQCGFGIIKMQIDATDAAEAFFKNCMRIYDTLQNIDNVELSIPLDNLARIRGQRGDFAGEAELYERLLSINASLGESAPTNIKVRQNLAAALAGKGDLAAAETMYRKVLELTRQVYGTENEAYADVLTNFGSLLQRTGRLSAAGSAFDEAAAILERLQANQLARAYLIGRMAGLAMDQSQLAKAERLYRDALAKYAAAGPDYARSGYSAAIMIGLSKTLLQLGKAAEARSIIQRALPIWKEKQDTARYGLSQAILGRSLYQQSQTAEGLLLLQQGYKSYIETMNTREPDAVLMRSWLAEAQSAKAIN